MPKTKVTPNQTSAIEESVMRKLDSGLLQMRPRWHFVLGSLTLFFGILTSAVTALFLIAIMGLLVRSGGNFWYSWRFEQLLADFPLWIPLVALLALFTSLLLLRRYDFSYKYNFAWFAFVFVAAIIASGVLFDALNLHTRFTRRGPMRELYHRLELGPEQIQQRQQEHRRERREYRLGQ